MIDKFDKKRFEDALTAVHPGWVGLGMSSQSRKGEEVYGVPVNLNARIRINSSIDQTGFAADSGEDSIRIWVEVYQPNWKNPSEMIWQATGKKVDAWTQRTNGWEDRMNAKITTLWNRAAKVIRPVNTCPKCGASPWVGFSQSEKNPGRPFASHKDCNYFTWLDKPYKKGEIVHNDTSVSVQQPAEVSSSTNGSGREDKRVQPKDSGSAKRAGSVSNNGQSVSGSGTDMQKLPEETKRIENKFTWKADDIEIEPDSKVRIDAEVNSLKKALKSKSREDKKQGKAVKEPNPSQRATIEAKPGTDIRLMAPPGSGKTYVIEHRYDFLVQEGVDPSNILVVTFSKKMADEMLERIKKVCPRAMTEQISTIHALCYRLLTRWEKNSKFYAWSVPKNWEVKKIVDELVKKYWQADKEEDIPGYSEILTWIDNSKFHGLTAEESRQYFVKNLGAKFGDWLYKIRRDFDARMINERFLRFADMLYYTEKELQNNEQFRTKWQSRFHEVIVDEAQDTAYQAMRILITLSLEPGNNSVYGSTN